MRKLHSQKGKFGRFLSSKGFYVAIAVCLVGAGAATWLAVDRTISGIENSNRQIIENEMNFNEFPPLEEADNKVTGEQKTLPDVSESELDQDSPVDEDAMIKVSEPLTQSSSSSTDSSSPEASSKPGEPSVQVQAQQTLPKLVYSLPAKGDILAQYSNGELVKNKTLGDWRTHDGIDIAVDKGADVLAAAEGTVSAVKHDPLWGTIVIIDHIDGCQTFYSGLSEVTPVKEGDTVIAMQSIGIAEGVPCETDDEKNHIHFALKVDGVWADPMSIL